MELSEPGSLGLESRRTRRWWREGDGDALKPGAGPVIAMRGYAGGGGGSDEAEECGWLDGVPVVARPDRIAGLLSHFATQDGEAIDVVVLDDGFQHRRIARRLRLSLLMRRVIHSRIGYCLGVVAGSRWSRSTSGCCCDHARRKRNAQRHHADETRRRQCIRSQSWRSRAAWSWLMARRRARGLCGVASRRAHHRGLRIGNPKPFVRAVSRGRGESGDGVGRITIRLCRGRWRSWWAKRNERGRTQSW